MTSKQMISTLVETARRLGDMKALHAPTAKDVFAASIREAEIVGPPSKVRQSIGAAGFELVVQAHDEAFVERYVR